MHCVLVALRDSLFAQNQLKIASRLRFVLLNKLIGLELDRKTVVSSANDIIFFGCAAKYVIYIYEKEEWAEN